MGVRFRICRFGLGMLLPSVGLKKRNNKETR